MRRMRFVAVFVAWTLVIWIGRLRNIWDDQDLDTAGQVGRSLLALSFVVGAVLVAVGAARLSPATAVKVMGAVGAWTAGVWAVRSAAILAGEWSLGFKVVHSVLAVVSVCLAAAAFRESRERASEPSRTGPTEPVGRSGSPIQA